MRRIAILLSAGVVVATICGPAQVAQGTSVVVDELLGGRLVESWGACEVPGGWVVVHHDGYTSAGGQTTGMRLFQGTDANAVVTRKWSRKSKVSGKVPDRHDCVSADFDRNGLVDFYVTAGRGGANDTKEGRGNELWLQKEPGIYRNRAVAWGVDDVCGRSHYAATADFNRDGYNDLFVGNASPRDDPDDPCDAIPGSEASHLYLNQQGAGFTDATSVWGLTGNGGVHCAEAGQFAGTRAPDLIVCRDGGLAVLRNTGGSFVDRRAAFGIPATNWKQATLGDVTGDGTADLVTATSTNVQVWPGFRAPALTAYSGDSFHGVGVNPDGDIFVVRSNPYTSGTNPPDVVLIREATSWSPQMVPGAPGLGDFALWLEGPQAWLVGNGLEDTLGPLQLVQTLDG
ncbi:MAG TPA: VCBS repeat-containing protein [Actinomycetes bacterium]|nr:VCBS repeat-containing protein [Actinomycetes bacterium]